MAVSARAAFSRTVTITDYLGLPWPDELVHEDLAFAPGELAGAAVVRVECDGKPVPSQVSDVVRHDDGTVRTLRVSFFVTVPAGGAVTCSLRPGRSGPASAENDCVTVRTAGDTLELLTGGTQPIGIRLPAGRAAFDWPVPAAEVPGPLLALLLPSGRWAGQGRFEVPFRVRSRETEVLAAGPLFAAVRVTYGFDVGYWRLTARVQRGSPVIMIDEELDTGFNPQRWDRIDRFYTLALNAGFKPTQAFYLDHQGPNPPELCDLMQRQFPETWQKKLRVERGNWLAAPASGFTLTLNSDRLDYSLTGWPSAQARVSTGIRFLEPGGDAVGFVALDTERWRNPLPLRFRETAKGELLACLPLQVHEQGWAADGFGRHSPNYTGRTLDVPEFTSRRSYALCLTPAEDELQGKLESLVRHHARLAAVPLQRVRGMVLDWRDPGAKEATAAQASPEADAAIARLRDWAEAKRAYGHLAVFSMAYHYGFARGWHAEIAKAMASPAAQTPDQRRQLRRLAAFLAYDMHSTGTFPWGTGMHLNNPNMSMMAVEARVKSAQLIPDHPQVRAWGLWTVAFMQDYLRRFTRATGAPYENPHYTLGVTLVDLAEANQALRAAGIGDALDSELFRRTLRFCFDWLTPPDPRFQGHRLNLPVGNGASYNSVPPHLAELLVPYLRDTGHAELAAQFQWYANQTLPAEKQVKLVEERVPTLGSVHHQDYGVFFRHGYGTPYETLFFLLAGDCEGHYEWESEQMAYTLWAKGQPISLHFANGYHPMFCRPWLRNRVSIDHKWETSERNPTQIDAVAFTPEAEYVRATRAVDQIRALESEYPLLGPNGMTWAPEEGKSWPAVPANLEDIPMTLWSRQVLFVKDADPKGPNYFVVRDGSGGTPTRPTDLSLWFLATAMERQGAVYHFTGQCLVDLDLFIATPAGTEPETGKYGHPQYPYGRHVGFDPKFFPDGKLREDQLFLRLRQPAGKGYLVVLYPRLKEGDPAAAFTRLDDNVVRVETPAATDYLFVSPFPFAWQDERVAFEGRAGAVRFYKSGRVAVMNSEGRATVRVAGRTVTGQGAFVVQLEGAEAKVTASAPGASAEVK